MSRSKQPPPLWVRILLVLLVLAPLAFLFFTPTITGQITVFWFWLFLLICLLLLTSMLGMGEAARQEAAVEPRMLAADEQPDVVRQVMDVRVATVNHASVRTFRGPLREPAEDAFRTLKNASAADVVPMLQDDEELGAAILLLPQRVEQQAMEHRSRPWLNWLLLALTFLTTTWAGAAHQGINLLREPERFAAGLPYALGIMAILGVHELAHFTTARRHGIRVTPPYFIPVPFALGTFGAFIQMKSPTENRRALFDVGVAGPLAGLAIAIPALLIGLRTSTVLPGNPQTETMIMGGTSVGSSILLALLSKLSLGQSLEYGHVLQLSPLAFAGWLGLIVTALNLLPIGQLDGGHISHALFGRRIGTTIGTVAMWSILLLAIFVWPGLMLWAIFIFFIAGTTTPPLNDLTPVGGGRRWLGFAVFAILALILAPLPHTFWSAAGIHCPYM